MGDIDGYILVRIEDVSFMFNQLDFLEPEQASIDFDRWAKIMMKLNTWLISESEKTTESPGS